MGRCLRSIAAVGLACLVVLAVAGCPSKPGSRQEATTVAEDTTPKAPPEAEQPEGSLAPPEEPEGGWEPYQVAASILTRKHPFYKDLEASLKDNAAKYGVTLDVQSSEFQSQKQRDQVQNFIVEEYNAIILCPADSDAVGGAVRLANEAHIPVFTADIAANSGDVVCHIASDNVQGGRLAGEYLAELLGGKGDIIIIDHPTVTSVQDRVRGFEEAVAEHPEMHIVDRPAADGQRPKAQQRTQTALLANPNVKAIFGINDDSALGALAALRQADREDVTIVGYDATEEACKEILAGSPLKADVVQYPKEIGSRTIDAVVKYLNGGDVPEVVPVPVGIVDREALQKHSGRPPAHPQQPH
jgi:ribose transport system substrate-binding protein